MNNTTNPQDGDATAMVAELHARAEQDHKEHEQYGQRPEVGR